MLSTVRRVAKTKEILEPKRDSDDSTFVSESLEAVFAVISPSTRTTHAAKGSVRDSGVEHDIVDCHATGLSIGED